MPGLGDRRPRRERQQVGPVLLRVDDEMGRPPEGIAGEPAVEQAALMGQDIVAEKTDPGARDQAQQVGDGAEGEAEEGVPPLHDHQVVAATPQGEGGAQPGQRVDRIDDRLVLLGDGRRAVVVLALSGEQERRILAAQGEKADRMMAPQLPYQKGRIVGDAAAKRVRQAEDRDRACPRGSSRSTTRDFRPRLRSAWRATAGGQAQALQPTRDGPAGSSRPRRSVGSWRR